MTPRHTTFGSPRWPPGMLPPPAKPASSAKLATLAPSALLGPLARLAPRAYGEVAAGSSASRAHGELCGGIAPPCGAPPSGDMGSRTESECVTQHLRWV